MNTSQIKAYAPKARTDFIEAVTERAARLGIHKDHIDPIRFEGERRDVAIIGDHAITGKEGEQRERLVKRVNQSGFEMFIRSSAYTWFNRFVAIRYMELHDFLDHGDRVLSSPDSAVPHSDHSTNNEGVLHPEIIDHAADVDLPGLDKEKVIELKLAGDRDNELFRMLFIAQCNVLHHAMPFLFEKVDNEEELLLPDNLLHTGSPLHNLVTQVDEALWEDVEIIGWIYQFYISEKKDEVIGKQVKSEDIPAATQLFTPNWIVKYMVQNTLGRMWLATYPDSSLREKMEYYIEPAEQEPDVQKELDATTPKELDPEKLTFLDPACGSGHILVEAYDILKEIYLERGYRTREIPRLILEKNLFGLDIDDRAAQLANFAVLMRARNDDRRLFSRDDLKSNILSITDTKGINQEKLNTALKNRDASSVDTGFWKWERVQELLELFEEAKTFGSLISIPNEIAEKLSALQALVDAAPKTSDDLFLGNAEKELNHLKPVIEQATLLSKKYDCVVANPPYMGTKGMNPKLKTYLRNNYPDVKSDIFSAFIVRDSQLALPNGQLGFMTPFVWMFISSYEKLRDYIISKKTITTLIQLEYSGFDGATVPICTFTFQNASFPEFKGGYIRLSDFKGAKNQAPKTLEAIQNPDCGWLFNASAADFKKIPGSPVAYWVPTSFFDIFKTEKRIDDIAPPRIGMMTTNNNKFLRYWFEVVFLKIGFHYKNIDDASKSNTKWFPYNKGGNFRRWAGNTELVVNWYNGGEEIKNAGMTSFRGKNFYFKEGITWGDVSSAIFSCRYTTSGRMFDIKGTSSFPTLNDLPIIISILNSKVSSYILNFFNPTISFQSGDIRRIPVPYYKLLNSISHDSIQKLIEFSTFDWDSYETSWDFTNLPLLNLDHHTTDLSTSYTTLRNHWHETTFEMKYLEEENNRIFIEAYGLEDEITPEVPLHEITIFQW